MDCNIEELMLITADLKLRLEKCENRLLEREKDVVFLKQQNKTCLIEVEQLKHQLYQQQHEQHDFKQLQVKFGNLSLKHIILEQKIETIANQVTTNQVTTLTQDLGKDLSQKESTNMETLEMDEDLVSMACTHELTNWKDTVNHQFELMDSIATQIAAHNEEVCRLRKMVEDNYAGLGEHVTNLENIVFTNSGSNDFTLEWKVADFQYRMYQGEKVFSPIFLTQLEGYRFQLMIQWADKQKGDGTRINDEESNIRNKNPVTINNSSSQHDNNSYNCFNIENNNNNNSNDNNNSNNNKGNDRGTNGQYLGLFLLLHRGRTDKLKPFNIPYTFQIEDKEGNILSKTVSLVDIMFNRAGHTILPGENKSFPGHGFPLLLKSSDLEKYIVNDMLSVHCKFG